MTESAFSKNLKKWFWGSFLTQLAVFAVGAIIFNATMSAQVTQNSEDIKDIKIKIDQKADLQTVMRIKADQDRVQQMILEDVQYIRKRIDEHMDKSSTR